MAYVDQLYLSQKMCSETEIIFEVFRTGNQGQNLFSTDLVHNVIFWIVLKFSKIFQRGKQIIIKNF